MMACVMENNARPFLTKHAVRKAARRIIDARREPDPFRNIFLTAVYLLEVFMGREWVAKRVFPKRASFLTPGLNCTAFNPNEAMMRVIELAEALLNLQAASGFDTAIECIRDRSLEPEMAPLFAAKMLFINGRSFRFVEPIGQSKHDFDLEIIYGGTTIACEVKCKLESTIISQKTVLDALEYAAKKQLPAGIPTLIFLHIPATWTEELEWINLLDRAANELFRSQLHVNAVFAISYKRFFKGAALSTTARFTKAYMHPSPRHPVTDLEILFTSSTRLATWTMLMDLLGYSPNQSKSSIDRQGTIAVADIKNGELAS